MSEKLGPLTFGEKQTSLFLGMDYGQEKNYSEETAREIDAKVKKVIQGNRSVLDTLASRLEEKEVLTGEEVESIVKKA